MWVPPLLIGFFLGLAIGILFTRKITEIDEENEEEEDLIDETKVEVGQVWVDRDWNDTTFEITHLHPTEPRFKAKWLTLDGVTFKGPATSTKEGTLDRLFFKNYKLLKEAGEPISSPSQSD
jgi:hypothetical protein